MLCDAVRCCAVLCRGACFAVLTLILMNHNKKCTLPAQLSPQLYIAHSSAAPRGAVRCRALLCGAVLFHGALCFLSNIQEYHVYDARYQVPGTGMYVFLYSSVSFLQS